jgi:hypothetical protein
MTWWYSTKHLLSSNWAILAVAVLAVLTVIASALLLLVSAYKRFTKAAAVTTATSTDASTFTLGIDTVSAETGSTGSLLAIRPAVPAVKVGFKDVITFMNDNNWLPIETACLFKAGKQLVQQRALPVVLRVDSSISVDTMISILQHKNVKTLHIDCDDLCTDIITALSQHGLLQQLLASSSITVCTIDTHGKMSFAALKSLIDHLPNTVTSLSVSEPNDGLRARYTHTQTQTITFAHNIRHLELNCICFVTLLPEGLVTLRAKDCIPWRELPSTLREFHTVNAMQLPRLPQGLLVLHMSSRVCETSVRFRPYTLPASLTHLKLSETQTHEVHSWPPSLEVLDVGGHYRHSLGVLPDTLTELTIRLQSDHLYMHELALPQSLKVLNSCYLWEPLEALPASLEVLKLDCYHHPLPELPSALRELMVAGSGYEKLTQALPHRLEVLDLAWAYDFEQPLKDSLLLDSLHTVRVCTAYPHSTAKLRSSIVVQRVHPRFDLITREIW